MLWCFIAIYLKKFGKVGFEIEASFPDFKKYLIKGLTNLMHDLNRKL